MSPRHLPLIAFFNEAIGIAESSPPSVEALPPQTRLLYCDTGDERYSPRAANLAHTPHPPSTVSTTCAWRPQVCDYDVSH
eukprot:COSAG06_NODE_39705_length_409_cov_1.645161_1_plen_79_part_10